MGYRALLIEDNPDHALLATRALVRDRRIASVDVCTTALEALDFLEDESHPKPDLILVDLRLPGISGFEFLKRVRDWAGAASIPIVILSTAASESEVRKGIDRGACAFISKPLRVEDLMNRLSAAGYRAPDHEVSLNGSLPKRRKPRRGVSSETKGDPEGRAP